MTNRKQKAAAQWDSIWRCFTAKLWGSLHQQICVGGFSSEQEPGNRNKSRRQKEIKKEEKTKSTGSLRLVSLNGLKCSIQVSVPTGTLTLDHQTLINSSSGCLRWHCYTPAMEEDGRPENSVVMLRLNYFSLLSHPQCQTRETGSDKHSRR